MAYWNGEKLVYSPPEPAFKTGWFVVDCHCCNGIAWGGDEPYDCYDCKGSGRQFLHVDSGLLAEYPGGPALGRYGKQELDKFRRQYAKSV